MSDAPAVLRFLRFGDDPTRLHVLRPEVTATNLVVATTVEAALWSREVAMIRLLDRAGAIVGSEQRLELGCLAEDVDVEQAADYLAPVRTCIPGAALKAVFARGVTPRGEQHD